MINTQTTMNRRSSQDRELLRPLRDLGRPLRDLGREGFTILELVLVGMAVSVIAATTVPQLTTTIDQYAVTMARDEFVRAHQFARSAAINYGRTAEVRIDAAEGRVWVEVDTTGSGERTVVGKVMDLSDSGVRMDASTSSLCFDSRGIAPLRGPCSGAGEFVFSNDGHTETVAISTTGLVY